MRSNRASALLEVEHVGGVTVARLARSELLAAELVEQFGAELGGLLARPQSRVVLSFHGVKDFGSSLLGQVAALHRRTHAADARLAVCDIPAALRPAFRVSGLDLTVPLYRDELEALRSFEPVSPAQPLTPTAGP